MVFIKISMLLSVAVLVARSGVAQGTRKTMLEQLAALRGYIITAEKGYHIAEDGLHLVRDIKSGEVNLHEVFFGSLKTVDEGVLKSPALEESYKLIAAIDDGFGVTVSLYAASGWLQANEIEYIGTVQRRVVDAGRREEGVLNVLTQDGVLSMTDGERIRKIDAITADVRARYGQEKRFLTGIERLIAQREKEQSFIGTLKKWYEIQ